MPLEGLQDPVGRDILFCRNIGEGTLNRTLEEPVAEALRDGPGAWKLGMTFPARALAIPAFEPALRPAQHRRISAGAIPDPSDRAAVTAHVHRSAVMAPLGPGRSDIDLQDAVDHFRRTDVKALQLDEYVDTIAHGGSPFFSVSTPLSRS
jgi:hypothetical protein